MSADDSKSLLAQEHARRSEQMAMVLNIGLRILSHRALTLVAMIANAIMFGWAMYSGEWPRLAVAGVFAVASWCLVNLSKGGQP